jgi:hypothetical protein
MNKQRNTHTHTHTHTHTGLDREEGASPQAEVVKSHYIIKKRSWRGSITRAHISNILATHQHSKGTRALTVQFFFGQDLDSPVLSGGIFSRRREIDTHTHTSTTRELDKSQRSITPETDKFKRSGSRSRTSSTPRCPEWGAERDGEVGLAWQAGLRVLDLNTKP